MDFCTVSWYSVASCKFFYHTVSTVDFHVIYWQLFVVSDHNPDGVGTWQVSSEGGTNHASYTNVHPRHAAADQGSNCSVCVRACVHVCVYMCVYVFMSARVQ